MNWLTQKQLQLWQELSKASVITLEDDDTIPFHPFLRNEFPEISSKDIIVVSWRCNNPFVVGVYAADESGHNGDYKNPVRGGVALTFELAICLTQTLRRQIGYYYCTRCGGRTTEFPDKLSSCCSSQILVRTYGG